MSLNVTRAAVKGRCGISDTTYDSTIDALIAELVPAIEYSIRPEILAQFGDTNLYATLNLGALEQVSGEFFAQLARQPGYFDVIHIGDLQLAPAFKGALDDPSGLIARGTARLAPFIRLPTNPALLTDVAEIITGGGKMGDGI